MKRALGLCVTIVIASWTASAAGEEVGGLESRLRKACSLLKTASLTKSVEGARYSASEVAHVFFHEDLIIDSSRVRSLQNDFIAFLDENGSDLSLDVLRSLQHALEMESEKLKERSDYIKGGWIRGISFGFASNVGLHAVDAIVGKVARTGPLLRQGLRRAAAWGRSKSDSCKSRVARIAMGVPSNFVHARPRLVQYAIGVPAVAYLSNRYFFRHYENWDASERAVKDSLLPQIEALMRRHHK